MVIRIRLILAVALVLQIPLLSLSLLNINAQITYTVEKNWSKAWINEDGSIDLLYNITLKYTSGKPQGIVTVGMPKDGFSLEYVRNSSGTSLKYEDISGGGFYGIDVYLQQPIIIGGNNTFLIYCIVPRMLSQDTSNPGNVGLQFYPTTFDDASGKIGNIRVAIVLPQGVKSSEVKHPTDMPFDSVFEEENQLVVYWEKDNWTPFQELRVGVSFPEKYVKLSPSLEPYLFVGLIALIVGISIFVVVLFRRRKVSYEKPKVSVEALGAARGFTAVEAAEVLQLKPIRILTMILFGLILKRMVMVTATSPIIKLQKLEKPAEENMSKPRYYEIDYLAAVDKDGSLDEMKLARTYLGLRDTVDRKLRGYSREDTENYYRSIVNNAWSQVNQVGTPELKSESIDRNIEWLLADDRFDERFKNAFPPDLIFLPQPGWYWYWHGPYLPPGQTRTPPTTPTEIKPIPGQDFANTVVKSLEAAGNSMVKNVQDFTNRLIPAQTAMANKRSVRAKSSCVCACANCACACACVSCACACAHGGAK